MRSKSNFGNLCQRIRPQINEQKSQRQRLLSGQRLLRKIRKSLRLRKKKQLS